MLLLDEVTEHLGYVTLAVKLEQIVQRLRLLDLAAILQFAIGPQQLSLDVLLHKLDAKEDHLLEEVDDEAFPHTASECLCLLLFFCGVHRLPCALQVSRVKGVGFLPLLGLF